VLIYEVFEFDLAGPQLDAANLRCKLNAARWLKIVDAVEEELNARLREAGMKHSKFRPGDNPLARLLGKEVVLLAWAIEDADPSLTSVAIQNWRGLAPEERWWLYTMTAAQTAHHSKHSVGWRKAIRFALTENPVFAPYLLGATAAEHRRRAKAGAFADTQGTLFTGEDQAAHGGIGIWEETCELPQRDTQTPPSPPQIQPSASSKFNFPSQSSPKSASKNVRQMRAKR
jgi:hypothetical protein